MQKKNTLYEITNPCDDLDHYLILDVSVKYLPIRTLEERDS
jgi:hypothetical protein